MAEDKFLNKSSAPEEAPVNPFDRKDPHNYKEVKDNKPTVDVNKNSNGGVVRNKVEVSGSVDIDKKKRVRQSDEADMDELNDLKDNVSKAKNLYSSDAHKDLEVEAAVKVKKEKPAKEKKNKEESEGKKPNTKLVIILIVLIVIGALIVAFKDKIFVDKLVCTKEVEASKPSVIEDNFIFDKNGVKKYVVKHIYTFQDIIDVDDRNDVESLKKWADSLDTVLKKRYTEEGVYSSKITNKYFEYIINSKPDFLTEEANKLSKKELKKFIIEHEEVSGYTCK